MNCLECYLGSYDWGETSSFAQFNAYQCFCSTTKLFYTPDWDSRSSTIQTCVLSILDFSTKSVNSELWSLLTGFPKNAEVLFNTR